MVSFFKHAIVPLRGKSCKHKHAGMRCCKHAQSADVTLIFREHEDLNSEMKTHPKHPTSRTRSQSPSTKLQSLLSHSHTSTEVHVTVKSFFSIQQSNEGMFVNKTLQSWLCICEESRGGCIQEPFQVRLLSNSAPGPIMAL